MGWTGPRCLLERDERDGQQGMIAMQLTLVPKFELPPAPTQEYIFIVDRSGSMSGDRIKTARSTLNILLRMLPNPSNGTGEKTKFNIWSFGSHADSMFPWKSQEYNATTLDVAVSFFGCQYFY